MAIWTIRLKDNYLVLTYFNLCSRRSHRCGSLLSSTSIRSVVEWILAEGKCNPHDLIWFETGPTFWVLPESVQEPLPVSIPLHHGPPLYLS